VTVPAGPIGDFIRQVFNGVCQLLAGIANFMPF
jgi:hypothetical protein